ncbi:MAG TPA: D-alanyl-D-alanine carboxypeptidase/D-alanyl-D-alanine-endopeptidase [Gemmatimonadaceae bacterium]|jgi:D-alanyl-D-alanine carboxypeptidase/D-alanyl-D-alanine-endopeptidase (penicillin-binding protein 4)
MSPRLLRLLPALAVAVELTAQPAPPKRIQEVMARPEFAHATWGMEFYDLQTKKTVYAVNRDRLFVPGSTTKLVTTGTAFATLGADYRFRTRIFRTGPVRNGIVQGDLVLVASGDPNLTHWEHPNGQYAFVDQDHSYGGPPLPGDPLAALRDMARQVVERGIHGATGQVIVDASLFREGTRELGTRIVISPLILNDNVIDIVVTPGVRAGDAVQVSVSPKTSYLTVQANLTTADSGTPAQVRTVEDSTDKDHRVLVGTGRMPVGPAVNVRWAVAAPSRFGEIVLSEVFNEAGIHVIPRLGSRTVDAAQLSRGYADSLVVAEHVSLPFEAAARVILKTSQNLHASSLPMLLGAQPAARDAGKNGFDVAREWLQGAGLNTDGAVQGDGAGGDAFFSPAFMTRYLEYIATQPWAQSFHDALPVLGTDGTLAAIQTTAPAAGRVHAKTGTFSSYDPLNKRSIVHAKGLAGYFTSRSGRRIAFAIYVNNFAANVPDPATFAGQALGEIASIAWEVIK